MKTTIRTLIILSGYLGFAIMYMGTPAPRPIQVTAPTERSIREDLKNEQRQRQYKSASLAASKVYKRQGCRTNLADITGRVAVEAGVSARVLAALVFVESSCNPNAVSNRGDIGLTQIHYRVWRQHTREEYFNPCINLETGASILASYVHRYGLKEGLHAYNGLDGPVGQYAEKVLTIAGIS